MLGFRVLRPEAGANDMVRGPSTRWWGRGLLFVAVAGAGLWLSVANSGAHEPEPAHRYPAAFFCDDDVSADQGRLRRETRVVIANPHDHPIEIEVAATGATSGVVQQIEPAGRHVMACSDFPAGAGSIGFLDIRSPVGADVVAFYQTSVAPVLAGGTFGEGTLASVTFRAQLEQTPQSEAERAALAELGIMVGKPVTLMVLTDITADRLVTPLETARRALRSALSTSLESRGLASEDAAEEAEGIVADSMRLWVQVTDTDIELGDTSISIDVVPIRPADPTLTTTTTTTPPDLCCVPPTGTAHPPCCAQYPPTIPAPITIVSNDAGSDLGWAAAATVIGLGLLALLVLGLLALLLAWLLWRRLRRPSCPPPCNEPKCDTPYRISCRILDECEVDVDDREATLEVSVDVVKRLPEVRRLTDGILRLDFDFTGQRVAFNGQARGPLTLLLGDLYWGTPVCARVKVTTGWFADPDREPPSAAPAVYWFEAEVSAMPEPRRPTAERLAGTQRLSFVIAPD